MLSGINTKPKIMSMFQKIFYVNYLKMRFLRLAGVRSMVVSIPNVLTNGWRLTIGNSYVFREGQYVTRVVLEDLVFKDRYVHVHLVFIEEQNRKCVCYRKATENGVCMGMWQLHDHHSRNE